jgi:hypothetical protein
MYPTVYPKPDPNWPELSHLTPPCPFTKRLTMFSPTAGLLFPKPKVACSTHAGATSVAA